MATHDQYGSGRRRLRIFLCHASEDKPQVELLRDRLRAQGADPWLDDERLLPGQTWKEEIVKAIKKSDIVIICLSSRAVRKEGFVQREIREALETAAEKPSGTIFVVPIRLDDECEPPDRLREFHWLDFFKEGAFDRLALALARRAADLQVPFPSERMTHRVRPTERVRSGNDIDKGRLTDDQPLGVHEAAVDDKGRLRLPSAFLAYFSGIGADEFFVTSMDRQAVRIYSLDSWRNTEVALQSTESESASSVLFVANSFGTTSNVDSHGRLTIPAELRRQLRIGAQRVRLMAMRTHVAVWPEEAYQAALELSQQKLEGDIKELEKGGLL